MYAGVGCGMRLFSLTLSFYFYVQTFSKAHVSRDHLFLPLRLLCTTPVHYLSFLCFAVCPCRPKEISVMLVI